MAEAHWYVVHTYSGYENKVKATKRRFKVIAHVGTNSIHEGVELAKHAQECGADAVVPHTNTPAICDVAIWSAYWEMIGRFSSPSVLNGVKVAATIPFRR